MRKSNFCLILLLVFCVFSCSLKYTEEETPELNIPEITFSQAVFNRYEEGKISARLQAEQLEQYNNDSSMYAKNVQFDTFDKKGEKSAQGSCDLISANTVDESYTLLGNVKLISYENNMSLVTNNMHWNGKDEQLTCGKDDIVSISRWNDEEQKTDDEKSDTTITMNGTGFAASGLTQSFEFSGPVSGVIYTTEEKE